MGQLNDTIHVTVEYFDGQAEGDVGYPYYVASCEEIAAVTDGKTWSELMKNVQEMIQAHLEGEDTIALYNLTPNPHIVLTMQLPEHYAEIT